MKRSTLWLLIAVAVAGVFILWTRRKSAQVANAKATANQKAAAMQNWKLPWEEQWTADSPFIQALRGVQQDTASPQTSLLQQILKAVTPKTTTP